MFRGRSSAFITWICPLLKPRLCPKNQYVYFEGDDINNIYFLIKGKVGYALPKYENVIYRNIRVGDHFGVIDIVCCMLYAKIDIEEWIQHKNLLHRQFTILSAHESEALLLQLSDLNRMKTEFYEAYERLFHNTQRDLEYSFAMRLKAQKYCEEKKDLDKHLGNSDRNINQNSQREPINISMVVKKKT